MYHQIIIIRNHLPFQSGLFKNKNVSLCKKLFRMGLDIENEKSSEIKNLVLFDLETTGLIRPEITELAICSIPFNLISNLSAVERVGNKLVLCFMPTRPIDPYKQKITNLSEEKHHGFDSFRPSPLKLLDAYIESLATVKNLLKTGLYMLIGL